MFLSSFKREKIFKPDLHVQYFTCAADVMDVPVEDFPRNILHKWFVVCDQT